MTAPKTKGRKRSAAERKTPQMLITRLRTSACKKCGRPLLVGHVMGEPTRIDRTRINSRGELVALLRGNKTYFSNSQGDRVFRRRATHITNESPPRYGYVLASHECGFVWDHTHYDLRDLWPTYRGEVAPF